MANLKLSPSAFYSYVQAEQLHEKIGWGFKTKFDQPLVYETYESLMKTTRWIDDVDVADYYDREVPKLCVAERDFSFKGSSAKNFVLKRRQNCVGDVESLMKPETSGKWRVLQELLKYNDHKFKTHVSEFQMTNELTLKNIKILGDILAGKVDFNKDITDNSSIEDIDELIDKIRQNLTINVLNVPHNVDMVNNRGNPFYLPTLDTAFVALDDPDTKIPGIVTPYLYYSSKFSHTVMHVEDRSYGSINVNLGPGSNLWIIINESHLPKFIKALKKTLKIRTDCPGFFRSKAYLVTCKWLSENKIPFRIAIQRPGEIIITPANGLHQVICLSESFKQAVNFPDPRWFTLTPSELYTCYGHPEGPHGSIYSDKEVVEPLQLLAAWNKLLNKDQHRFVSTIALALNLPESNPTISNGSMRLPNPIARSSQCIRAETLVAELESDVPKHFSVVTVRQPYKRRRQQCPYCKMSFCENRRLNQHISREHVDQVNHRLSKSAKLKDKVCIVCNKAFSFTYDLSKHIRTFHPTSNVVVNYKRKSQKANLNAFKCKICDKSYELNHNLTRHVKLKHLN